MHVYNSEGVMLLLETMTTRNPETSAWLFTDADDAPALPDLRNNQIGSSLHSAKSTKDILQYISIPPGRAGLRNTIHQKD